MHSVFATEHSRLGTLRISILISTTRMHSRVNDTQRFGGMQWQSSIIPNTNENALETHERIVHRLG